MSLCLLFFFIFISIQLYGFCVYIISRRKKKLIVFFCYIFFIIYLSWLKAFRCCCCCFTVFRFWFSQELKPGLEKYKYCQQYLPQSDELNRPLDTKLQVLQPLFSILEHASSLVRQPSL